MNTNYRGLVLDLQARHDWGLPALRVQVLAPLFGRVCFRYNNRVALEVGAQRADNILDGVTGKRLTYQTIS